MNQITGRYTREAGSKKTYDYIATIYPFNGGFMWQATVRNESVVKGMPSGRVQSLTLAHAEMAVRANIKACIENLDGIVE